MAPHFVGGKKLLAHGVRIVKTCKYRLPTERDFAAGRELLRVDIRECVAGFTELQMKARQGWTYLRINQEPIISATFDPDKKMLSYCHVDPPSSERGLVPLTDVLRAGFDAKNLENNRFRYFVRS